MKQRIWYLCKIYLLFILFFVLVKPIFLFYNLPAGTSFSFVDALSAIWHGLSMDAAMSGYLLVFPFLITWLSLWFPKIPVKHILLVWLAVCSLLIVSIAVVDTSLYSFWQFKLDATVFFYLDSPSLAFASVSVGYIMVRVMLTVFLTLCLIRLFFRFKIGRASCR